MKTYNHFLNIINEKNEQNTPLIEGIDIDLFHKTVSFNNKHENNVDTSDIINPTYTIINNVDVISIFKRKKNISNLDGNPLIKALKNIDDWKFKNCEKDIMGLLKQFIKIVNKIDDKYDTIILVPSKNKLNTEFLHKLDKILIFDNKIEDFFSKLTCDEVLDNGIDRQAIKDQVNGEKIWADIYKSFLNMSKDNNGWFSYKYIKPEYRKYICKTMSYNNDTIYENIVNNKNILILDDTISTGSTISETVENIKNIFTPNKITVITLFSSL